MNVLHQFKIFYELFANIFSIIMFSERSFQISNSLENLKIEMLKLNSIDFCPKVDHLKSTCGIYAFFIFDAMKIEILCFFCFVYLLNFEFCGAFLKVCTVYVVRTIYRRLHHSNVFWLEFFITIAIVIAQHHGRLGIFEWH